MYKEDPRGRLVGVSFTGIRKEMTEFIITNVRFQGVLYPEVVIDVGKVKPFTGEIMAVKVYTNEMIKALGV